MSAAPLALTFIPKHNQPFTLAEAITLDISVLTAEIHRLENSIRHLEETQLELREFLEEEQDTDILLAVEENELVIGSQRERIMLIKIALMNKVGKEGLEHYGLGIEDEGGGEKGGMGTNEEGNREEGALVSREERQESLGEDDGLHL
ncbi:hypothetical protein P7C73_g3689, partial [Tremellales sp. Uapishka_1]